MCAFRSFYVVVSLGCNVNMIKLVKASFFWKRELPFILGSVDNNLHWIDEAIYIQLNKWNLQYVNENPIIHPKKCTFIQNRGILFQNFVAFWDFMIFIHEKRKNILQNILIKKICITFQQKLTQRKILVQAFNW